VAGLAAAFGSGATTNSIREIRDADCILVTGSNTGEAHPVVSYEVVRAVKRGATLIVIDPRRISLVRHAAMHLRPAPGADHALYLGMLHAIVANGWHDEAFIRDRTEGFEALAESLRAWTPEVASAACGVPAVQIVEAARCYALGLRREAATNGALPETRGASSILYGMGITERANGTELVKTLANLAMAAGQIGRPSVGVNPLRGQSNVQGGCDMGSLPNVYPGYQRVDDPDVRAKFARAWAKPRAKPASLAEKPGLTFMEMIRGALDGRIRAMYIMGANTVMTNPDAGLSERALRALDFLVVQEILPTETAQLAHVVLPAASFAEKSGTFTNLERRVQLLRPVLSPPGEARPDWQILCEVGARLGRRLRRALHWDYGRAADVMAEIARLAPIFGGISHARLEFGGIQWPCPSPEHPGTPIMHRGQFTRGRGKFHVTAPTPPFEPTDETYPLALSTGRILHHYNGGPMTRRSVALDWREPRAYVEVNPKDAASAGVRDGQPCLVHSRRGSVRVQARVGDVVPPGMVYMPLHFREGAANVLTHADGLDAGAKTPEYKYCAVRIERVGKARE
jgi:predicted molibdopterin-dependent oxidoreductase YjgC